MRYIGVDLHTTQITVCYLMETDKASTKTYSLEKISEFIEELTETDSVAVEATTNTNWFVSQIENQVAKVVIVEPRSFEVIRRSVKKTDERDALALARFLRAGLLPGARRRSLEQETVQSLANTREKLVGLKTKLINQIHALLVRSGRKEKRERLTSQKGFRQVIEKYSWTEVERIELEVIGEQLTALAEGIKKLDEAIQKAGERLEGFENLSSIKGIGAKSAAVLLSVIGRVEDFASEGRLASYFGIVPRVRNSNETVHHGRITKQGSRMGRATLVQCALVAIRYSPYLKKFYEAIKQRRGAGKAIIAVARKFLGIIYHTLKNKWVFEDFPNFVLAE
jgi:transposase